jgi:hypothetical protein
VPKGVEVAEPIGGLPLRRRRRRRGLPAHARHRRGQRQGHRRRLLRSAGETDAISPAARNDLYAGHGAQLTYIAACRLVRETLSFQFNSTVARRDARVQSLNLHLGARQARHESLSASCRRPARFSEMLALTVAHGAQEFDQRTLQIHQAPNTKLRTSSTRTRCSTRRRPSSPASSSSIPTRRRPTPTRATAT